MSEQGEKPFVQRDLTLERYVNDRELRQKLHVALNQSAIDQLEAVLVLTAFGLSPGLSADSTFAAAVGPRR
jgi:hypothetical protein